MSSSTGRVTAVQLLAWETLARENPEGPLAAAVLAMLDELRTGTRAHAQLKMRAQDYKEHLESLRAFLKEGWDEDDNSFDAYNIERVHALQRHWCKVLIEELDEMLEAGAVYNVGPLWCGGGWPPVE